MVNNADSFLNSLNKSQTRRKDVPTLERILPVMARDMNVMKNNMVKLVSIQGGTPRTRAEQFFAKAESKENDLEANFKRGNSPSKASGPGMISRVGKGLGFGSNTSIKDFIGNILKFIVKGALASLGVMGISKLLDNPDMKSSITDFIKNLFLSVLNIIKSGAEMISGIMKDDDGKIKEAVIGTFVAIKDLLVQSIKNIGELLSDPRVMKGIVDIVFAISDAIKKIFEAEVDLSEYGMGKTSLGKILADMALAFGAVYTASLIAAGALRQIGANMIGGGAGAGAGAAAAGAALPGIATAANIAGGTFVAYEALTAADRQRAKSDAEAKARKEGKSSQEIAKAGQEAYDRAGERQNEEFLGAMDESTMGSAIMEASGKKEPSKQTTPTPAKPDTTKPLSPNQIIGVQSEAKKFLGKNAAEYLAAKEGFSAVAYLDPPGNKKNQYSIGHGHLIQSHEVAQGFILLADGKKIPVSGVGGKDTKITKEQAKLLLQSDLPKYEKLAADPLGPEAWAKLSDDQKTALISYAYNTGSTASLVKAGLKDAILKGDMEKAADIISSKGIKTADGKFHVGLEARRMSESTLFAGGQFKNTPGAESPTMLAKNETKAPESGKSETKSMLSTLLDDMTEQLAALDQMMGGKLGIDSIGLQTAFRQMDKEFMNNPTFVDSSTTVSNASAPAPGTAVSASVWDSQMTSLFVDRVA